MSPSCSKWQFRIAKERVFKMKQAQGLNCRRWRKRGERNVGKKKTNENGKFFLTKLVTERKDNCYQQLLKARHQIQVSQC